jgi:hypothetical protein
LGTASKARSQTPYGDIAGGHTLDRHPTTGGIMAVTLGKDVTVTGLTGVRSITINNTANEVDVTKFGDTARKFRKALVEQTVEAECVDDPGVEAGDTFTISGTSTGNVSYIVTSVAKSDPIDGITTYTVSGSRGIQS